MPAAVEKKVTMTPGGLSKIMKTLKNTDNGGVQKKTSAVAETPSKKDKKKKDNKKDLPKPAPSRAQLSSKLRFLHKRKERKIQVLQKVLNLHTFASVKRKERILPKTIQIWRPQKS